MMRTLLSLGAASVLFAATFACSSDSNDKPNPGNEIKSGGSGGQAPSTSGGSGGRGGTSGRGGNGSGGKDGNALPVPRIEKPSGPSVLDKPIFEGTPGLCPVEAVYCNGKCLDKEGASEGNCSVAKLGINQPKKLALSQDALFYTSNNTEILRMDLATGKHSSLVTGLRAPDGLHVAGDVLYFGSSPPNEFDGELRSVSVRGGDVTVLSELLPDTISYVHTLSDRLVVGIGTFTFYVHTVPSGGGQSTAIKNIVADALRVEGESLYYFHSSSAYVASFPNLDAPLKLNNEARSWSPFIIDNGFWYLTDRETYRRAPVGGGPTQEIQAMDAGVRVLGRAGNRAILVKRATDKPEVLHLLTMPISGGTPTELATLEWGEPKDWIANDTELFIALSAAHGTGIVRVKL